MRLKTGLAAVAALALGLSMNLAPSAAPLFGVTEAHAAAAISVDVMFNSLGGSGSWVHMQRYPYVWVPANVGAKWAPYTNGHWIYTDQYGWYFESDEPFAWAVYHYGRWDYDPQVGWFWVPGTKWAPAWVAWRTSGDTVGWAPLPPDRDGYAVDVNVSVQVDQVPHDHWFFVPMAHFQEPRLVTVVQRGDRAPDFFTRTRIVTPRVQANVVINNVVDINIIAKQTNRKVVVHKIEQVNDPGQARTGSGDTVRVFSADIDASSVDKAKPKKVVDVTEAKRLADTGGTSGTGTPSPSPGSATPAAGCAPLANGKLPANCAPANGNANLKLKGGVNGNGNVNANGNGNLNDKNNLNADVGPKTGGKTGAADNGVVGGKQVSAHCLDHPKAKGCGPAANGNGTNTGSAGSGDQTGGAVTGNETKTPGNAKLDCTKQMQAAGTCKIKGGASD